jgi:hypothetical protein
MCLSVKAGWTRGASASTNQTCAAARIRAFNANAMFSALEKDGHELEDVAAQVILFVVSFDQRHSVSCPLVFRWFQLFTDRLVRFPRRDAHNFAISHFPQAYYESNLDAFPSSRKERKTVALKRVTGTNVLFYFILLCFLFAALL